jgi:Predicted metal-dependent enzyme
MDFKKIFIKNACPTKVGGQAVLEGIMMKGEDRTAVVVRKPNGKLHIKTELLKKPGELRKVPILRGVFIFVDSLVVGTRTLLYSAEVLENSEGGEEYEKDKMTVWLEKRFGEKGAMNAILYFSVFLAILFTVGIFIIAPTAVVNVFKYVTTNEIALNLIEGVFRIALFVVYILIISKMKDIQTVFQFHGAEHKCIHCYENGLELTPENCKPFETLHPRCGTSFLMFVMVISLLLFSLLGWPNLIWRITSRLLLIPIIAGLSYELLRWAGRSDSAVVKILSIPGLLLQKLTTKEPNREQLEVAIAAMKAVLVPADTPTYEGECDGDGRLVPEPTEPEDTEEAKDNIPEEPAETVQAESMGETTEE